MQCSLATIQDDRRRVRLTKAAPSLLNTITSIRKGFAHICTKENYCSNAPSSVRKCYSYFTVNSFNKLGFIFILRTIFIPHTGSQFYPSVVD